MSQRDLRGFDRRRLYAVLCEGTVVTLQAMLATCEESGQGPKDAVVHRACTLIANGRLAVRTALREAPKATLQSMCGVLDLAEKGTVDELVDRLDRAVRYGPLGDADEVPEAIQRKLPNSLDERERLFALELHARLARRSRGSTTLPLGELIGRLGRRAAAFRARAEAARDVGAFLSSIGVASSPDLNTVTTSPGVDAEIDLSVRSEWMADAPVTTSTPGNAIGAELDAVTEHELAEDIATLGMGIARADDIIHPDEEALVRAYARRRGAGPAVHGLLLHLRTESLPLDDVARRLAARLDLPQRRSLLQHLCDVALADGVLVDEEVTLLRRLGELLESPLMELDELARRFRPLEGMKAPAKSALPSRTAVADAEQPPPLQVSDTTTRNVEATGGDVAVNSGESSRGATAVDKHVDEIISLLFN